MPVNGFDDAKNKVNVYTTIEVDTNKQAKHITFHVPLFADSWIYNSTLSRYEQKIQLSGLTENDTVIVAPDPLNYVPYIDSMVVCAGQGISGGGQSEDALIFTCNPEKVPTYNIWANVLILGV